MAAESAREIPAPPRSILRSVAAWFYRHPNWTLLALLAVPMAWMLVVYVGSLSALLAQSFFRLDAFSGRIVREVGLSTYQMLLSDAHRDIFVRTTVMAALVTLTCAAIAFPLAYYMARYASFRTKTILYLAVLLPLWSSYLVRVYTWKIILAQEGIVTWVFQTIGLKGVLDWILNIPSIGGTSLSFSYIGMWLVFVYIWLPYMVLPISAALERVPKSLMEASADLGARPGYTFRRVILPLAFPGVVAGSIFTFSLTLGDYIIPSVIGNSSYFIGPAVYTYQGTAGNIPLAAAVTVVPVVIMLAYLLVARRLGAFDAL